MKGEFWYFADVAICMVLQQSIYMLQVAETHNVHARSASQKANQSFSSFTYTDKSYISFFQY